MKKVQTISRIIDVLLIQADKVSIRWTESLKTTWTKRDKLTAEEAIAMQEESPASTHHDDQADHHHRHHHRHDVDVLWKGEQDGNEHLNYDLEKNSPFPISLYWHKQEGWILMLPVLL